MPKTLTQIRTLLSKRQQVGWLLTIPLALASAALEAGAAATVFLLIRLIDDPAASAPTIPPFFPGWIREVDHVALFAVGVAVLFVLKNLVRVTETWFRHRRAQRTGASIAAQLFRHYLKAPWSFHLQNDSAACIHRIQVAATLLPSRLLVPMMGIVSEALVSIGMLLVLLIATPGLALASVAIVGGLLFSLLHLTKEKQRSWGHELNDLGVRSLEILHQGLGGVKELGVLGRARTYCDRFAHSRVRFARVEVFRGVANMSPRLLVETVFVMGVVAVVFGARAGGHEDLFARVGLFAYAGLRMLPSLHWITVHVNEIRSVQPALEAVCHDWRSFSEGEEPDPAGSASGVPPFADRISFDGVSYAYPEAPENAVSDLSLEIRRGESVGIVGPTGSGKTTVIDLVLGVLVPTSGTIRVDGRDLHAARSAWQAQIGYVPQNPYLINDSIRSNIAFGLDDPEIDDRRVREAMELAQLDRFVASLRDGLETRVGETGVRLSGGERQRIAIARALYRDPAVLVLDEATSSLDNATERALSDAMESLRGEKTLIIVAHRLSTVRACDRLIVMVDGRIVDCGGYDELASRNPVFRELAEVA